ncbi:MAG: uracil phosphoribosyltransferase [Gammaproteobacteria bacterium]
MNNNVQIIKHPLLEHKLTLLRDQTTNSNLFRNLIYEIGLLVGYEACKQLQLVDKTVTTPTGEAYHGKVLDQHSPVIVPILRAGAPLADAIIALIPDAKIGHIGLARNEQTLESSCYLFKIPTSSTKRPFILCDPMLATGGSANHAVSILKEKGISNIRLISILGAPEGVENFCSQNPDVPVFLAALDRQLNDKGYILPGLGDAGDRVCGT